MDNNKRLNDLIDEVLNHKEKNDNASVDLDCAKSKLFDLMKELKLNEFQGEYGIAKIMDFNRQSLKKDETISAISEVNNGKRTEINIEEITSTSNVNFVSVRSRL